MWDLSDPHSTFALCRLKWAYEARAKWNKAIKYLRQQGEERLELEKNLF